MSNELNPQPLPPRSGTIDIGHLTEVVTGAIQRSLSQHQGKAVIVNPRIIIGIIAEPQLLQQLEHGGPVTRQ
jgi:hypothetical protein